MRASYLFMMHRKRPIVQWLLCLGRRVFTSHQPVLISLNLSHYEPVEPEMDRGHGKKRRQAGCQTLPTDDQTTVLLLKPGEGPRRLETRHVHLAGSTARLLGLPHACGYRRSDATGAQLLTEVFRIIACSGGDNLRPFPGTSTPARPQVDGVPQRQPVIRTSHNVFTTWRQGVWGLPRPRGGGTGGKMSATSCHAGALKPSKRPAIVPSSRSRGHYNTALILVG
jgi:hypothetical protein